MTRTCVWISCHLSIKNSTDSLVTYCFVLFFALFLLHGFSQPPCHQIRLITMDGFFIDSCQTSQAPPANYFTPLITHTFRIIIKWLCRLFVRGTHFKDAPGCVLFRHIHGGIGCLSESLPHPPPGRRCFFVSRFNAAIITVRESMAAL